MLYVSPMLHLRLSLNGDLQYPKYISKFRDEVFTKEVSLAMMLIASIDEICSIGTKASLVYLCFSNTSRSAM